MSLSLKVLSTDALRSTGSGGARKGGDDWAARPSGSVAAPPAAPHRPGYLIDSHGRVIRDLRISITDRCNFRCVYCLDPGVRFLPADQLMSVDEIVRVASVCVGLGVRKIRLTGGEPTLHPQLTEIIARLSRLPLRDLSMTTNGSRSSPENLRAWRDAGLRRLTVSIDSTNAERFAEITRAPAGKDGDFDRIIEGVREAVRIGLNPVRLNAVVIRGVNEDQVADLAGLARDLNVDMRFIEFMPLDSGRAWGMERVVPASEIVERISSRWPLVEVGRPSPSSTAIDYRFADRDDAGGAAGRIGIIAPVTRPFCGACSRLRITADGKIRPCLFSGTEWDLMPLLRQSPSRPDAAISEFLQDAVWTKQAGHGISSAAFVQPERTMSAIGG